MKADRIFGLLVLMVMLVTFLAACGGGGDDTNNDPVLPDPAPNEGGGDPNTPSIIGEPLNPWGTYDGQPWNDLRGVAASSKFVYIADATSISVYRQNGQPLRRVGSPYGATIQAIAVFPETIDVNVPDGVEPLSPFAGLPVILHNPVPNIGYVTIMPENLDGSSTIEDAGNDDLNRLITLPNGQIVPPIQPVLPPYYVCDEVIDMAVDPFGSIFVSTKVYYVDGVNPPHDPEGHQSPAEYRAGIQVFNRFNDYQIEYGGQGWPVFHKAFGQAIGYLGDLAISPHVVAQVGDNLGRYSFNFYTGDSFAEGSPFFLGGSNYLDFVGRSTIDLDFNLLNPGYIPKLLLSTPPYYGTVFGILFGEQFAAYANGADPDLTAGGPSGLFVSDFDGRFYACDPGNDRIMVYDGLAPDALIESAPQPLNEIIGGLDEPSEIMVDEFGRTFICDFNNLVTQPGQGANIKYGNVGGTVRHIALGEPMVGATVTIQDEFGILGQTQTNINGDYLFNYAPYGQYLMTASKYGYIDDSFVVTIVPDETVRVDFNLTPREQIQTGNYLGVVYDDYSRSYLRDVMVSIIGTSISQLTDGSGKFKFSELAEGTYQVVFSKEGYKTRTLDVQVTKNETTYHPDIRMKRVTQEEQPAPDSITMKAPGIRGLLFQDRGEL